MLGNGLCWAFMLPGCYDVQDLTVSRQHACHVSAGPYRTSWQLKEVFQRHHLSYGGDAAFCGNGVAAPKNVVVSDQIAPFCTK